MPTLTPPNEPLTWNELGNMVGNLYISSSWKMGKLLVLVHTVDDIKGFVCVGV